MMSYKMMKRHTHTHCHKLKSNMDSNVNVFKHNKKKKKRKRTVISPEESDRLEREFLKDHRPDRMTKMELAKEMGKPENVISTWFQNRRAREKKMAKLSTTSSQEICSTDDKCDRSIEEPLNLSMKEMKNKETQNPSIYSQKPVRSPLFGRLVRMAAAAEGGILSLDCPEINEAMMDACSGILLKDARLVYHPSYGFDIESFTE